MELLQSAAKSEKKDKKLPGVVFNLLQVSLKEDAFELFWKEGVENGLLKEKSGPVRFVLTFVVFHIILLFLAPVLLLPCGRMEHTVSHDNVRTLTFGYLGIHEKLYREPKSRSW